MPINRQVVKKKIAAYASLLLDGAFASGGQEAAVQVRDELEALVRYTRESLELANALDDKRYTPEQHKAIMVNVLTGLGVTPLLVEALAVMAQRGDFSLVSRVWASYTEQLEQRFDLNIVDVTTAVPLDDGLRQLISEKAAADLGTRVVLREHIDRSILGGIIMSARGRRIDASIRSHLEGARRTLKQSQMEVKASD
ncbi:MAG: F0F1 ATP synthase subunit delta [Coriobacteriaceae bacterium]|jgi:F-type H+-transporting ATPase subunit delta|nr:F0F1 ATP synthase subunit delta [Coriobacteriaceae bacterium]